jgi:hypothetical protein
VVHVLRQFSHLRIVGPFTFNFAETIIAAVIQHVAQGDELGGTTPGHYLTFVNIIKSSSNVAWILWLALPVLR